LSRPTDQLEIEHIRDPARAAALLDPIRLEILALAREPASATAIANHLDASRQKVNYHVKQLARARLLRKAGTRRRRNLIEQRYVASARAYVLVPELIAPFDASSADIDDRASAAYLVALTARTQAELARVFAQAGRQKLATLSMTAALRFRSAAQRAEFAHNLRDAVADCIDRFTAPLRSSRGRPFRLMLGCYPIPKDDPDE
jgi:DNA-binding transcriptional ArsR family regulator